MLDALSTPKKVAGVAKEVEEAGVDVEAELAWLRERGLIFHEGERYLSLLVAPPRPIAIPLVRTEFAAAVAA